MKTILYLSVAYPPKDGRDFQLMFSGLFETSLNNTVRACASSEGRWN